MPLYTYLCDDCGFRFKKMAKFEDRHEGAKCECGETADREMPKTSSSVISTAVTGPTPQNTGYASLDAHIDRVIGQSAEMGWEFQGDRQHTKDQAAVSQGVAPGQKDIMYQEPDGTWRVMTQEEIERSRQMDAINKKAMSVLSRRKRKLSSDGRSRS